MLSLNDALPSRSHTRSVKRNVFDRLLNRTVHQRPSQQPQRNCLFRRLQVESLEKRALLAAAIFDGDWHDPNTWDGGVVPDANTPALISHGITVQLDGVTHVARDLTVHGNLVVPEEGNSPTDSNKSLNTRWIHVNSGGLFQVGSEADRFDEGTFTLELNGTDKTADHLVATNMMGTNPSTMNVMSNDGFLMTAMGGRVQFYGEEKLSFTKLHATAEVASSTIVVENVIERNYDRGATSDGEFVTSAQDDGELNWAVDDEIVIASSSYDYKQEEVRTIKAIMDNGDGTSTLTLNNPLAYEHYGEIETYGESLDARTTDIDRSYVIDMRAEVALLSRNVKIQGLSTQDTDVSFGDRANLQTEARFRDAGGNPIESEDVDKAQANATGLSHEEAKKLPSLKAANGVGAHIMIMPDSGQITVDGVQLDGMGQAGQKGRYPIHWHLGDSRPDDVLKNSSITNSNNRGVTIHGTSDLLIEGVVLHDVHGHGFFFEDAVETGNVLVANLALGIHTVGGNDANFFSPGTKDPLIVDTHDSVLETGSRFSSSAGFWITNPKNTFVGNIVAGMGDSRPDDWAEAPGPAGTGFWYALPRTALGASSAAVDASGNLKYADVTPIFGEFKQFDYNTSHSTAVGLNFDRGSDIEDATFLTGIDVNSIQPTNEYSPRLGGVKGGDKISSFVNGFTNYKASEAAVYHRGDGEQINFNNLRVADSYNGPWAVSENLYNNSLFVGHSRGNHGDHDTEVGGPRLYDGAGLYTNTHFAGFAHTNADVFQVEGSSFGPTMYHAFQGTTFENDGTFDHVSHAVSDFSSQEPGRTHNLGQPSEWIKAALDLDGTLTGGFTGGGIGSSIVPNVDFLVDDGDTLLPGGEAWLTNDLYARMRIQNKDDGEPLFPPGNDGDPLIRFTVADGDSIEAIGGQEINEQQYWTQIAVKADSDADGFIEDTLTVEFGRKGLPPNGFVLNMDNQDGGRPGLVQQLEDKVNASRLVSRFVGARNYTPSIDEVPAVEVFSESELRSINSGVAFFRDASDLYLNTSIVAQPYIDLAPGPELQSEFPSVLPLVNYNTTIQAEEFDNGVDGIAYHDSDAINSMGTFRSDTGVDATTSTVGEIVDGEWLEYTANIAPNAYSIGVNLSSTQAAGQVRILAAESNTAGFLKELGVIDVPNTQGSFTTVWLDQADLSTVADSESVIRLEFDGTFAAGFEIDSLRFEEPIQTHFAARTDLTIDSGNDSTRIELEHFDNGGPGVAYFDDSPENKSSTDFRVNEAVDTSSTQLQGDVFDNEWLEYTTDIQAGIYDITLRRDWSAGDAGLKLFVGESNSASETDLAPLGEFTFGTGPEDEFIKLEGIDLSPWAGSERVIRIEVVGRFMGLDYLEFDFVSSSQSPFVNRVVSAGLSTRIEMEEFDLGGQGLAYFDTTIGNTLADNTYRITEDVEANDTLVTNEVFEGEWLEYTTDIEAGVYDVTLRKAWGGPETGARVLVGDSNSATEFIELGELVGEGEFFTLQNIDLAQWAGANRVIRVEIIGNWMGLDYLDFTKSTATSAPTVESFRLGSSAWPAHVTSQIDVTEGDGYVVPWNDNQLTPMSWEDVDTLYVTFSEDVSATFSAANLNLEGIVVPSYKDRFDTVTYDIATNTGIVSLNQPIGRDRLRLTVSDNVTSSQNVKLDGEFVTESGVGRSGDGNEGGDFHFLFNMLPGDIDGDGLITEGDLNSYESAYFTQPGQPNYSSRADVNGDGLVTIGDLQSFSDHYGQGLPVGVFSGGSSDLVGANFATSLSGDQQVVTLNGSEIARSAVGEPLNLHGTTDNDTFVVGESSSLSLNMDGGLGVDVLVPMESSSVVDITALQAAGSVSQIEVIDLREQDRTRLRIHADDILQIAPVSKTLVVYGGPDDQIVLNDGFEIVSTRRGGGHMYVIARSGEATLQIAGMGWTNPISPNDVDNSGDTTALDALRIINRLVESDQDPSVGGRLVDPATLDQFPMQFYDTSGDGQVTALDALTVINDLNRQAKDGGEPIEHGSVQQEAVVIAPADAVFANLDTAGITRQTTDVDVLVGTERRPVVNAPIQGAPQAAVSDRLGEFGARHEAPTASRSMVIDHALESLFLTTFSQEVK